MKKVSNLFSLGNFGSFSKKQDFSKLTHSDFIYFFAQTCSIYCLKKYITFSWKLQPSNVSRAWLLRSVHNVYDFISNFSDTLRGWCFKENFIWSFWQYIGHDWVKKYKILNGVNLEKSWFFPKLSQFQSKTKIKTFIKYVHETQREMCFRMMYNLY